MGSFVWYRVLGAALVFVLVVLLTGGELDAQSATTIRALSFPAGLLLMWWLLPRESRH